MPIPICRAHVGTNRISVVWTADCCDGSDEVKGKCSNTCLQASAAHRESLKSNIAQYEQALATKADFISQARAFKQKLQTKAATIDQDYAAAQAEVERLKGEYGRSGVAAVTLLHPQCCAPA